jgi:hypothetical protein
MKILISVTCCALLAFVGNAFLRQYKTDIATAEAKATADHASQCAAVAGYKDQLPALYEWMADKCGYEGRVMLGSRPRTEDETRMSDSLKEAF